MSSSLAEPGLEALSVRAELVRAAGAVLLTPPPASDHLCEALGLDPVSAADHTDAFVLTLVPHAAVHLGPDGQLGGEGLDRVEGFWRALGLRPPADADHLGVLLMAYADLLDQLPAVPVGGGRAPTDGARDDPAGRAAATLFHEHLWPFAPPYLAAVAGLGLPGVEGWAELTAELLRAERGRHPEPPSRPLALRQAPPAIEVGIGFDDLLDAVVTPVRTGLLLTQRDLRAGAAEIGVGYRRGERRFALRAMLEQDKAATLDWLGRQAHRWAEVHTHAYVAADGTLDGTARWWISRARHSATVLDALAATGPRRDGSAP